MSVGRASARVGAGGLALLAGLHCIWATGSSWPLPSRAALSDRVPGSSSQTSPSGPACLAVAALLMSAAALVDGHPRGHPRIARLGSTGVVAVLTARGVPGMVGRTDLLAPGSTSAAFRSRDRWIYSPVALALAGLSLPAALRSGPGADRA